METRDLFQRIKIIFGIMMVFFYIGFGLFFIFAPLFEYVNIVIRTLFGAALALYGVVRAQRAYEQVREVFFRARKEDQD